MGKPDDFTAARIGQPTASAFCNCVVAVGLSDKVALQPVSARPATASALIEETILSILHLMRELNNVRDEGSTDVQEALKIGVEVAATDEVVGEGAGLVERPCLEGGHELAMVNQPVLQREQSEEKVAVGGGHDKASTCLCRAATWASSE